MARPRERISVEEVTEGWIDVSEDENVAAFRAWRDYRREALGCHFVPKAYTVPSIFPPSTPQAALAYRDALAQIRKCIGWEKGANSLPGIARVWNA